MSDPNSEPNWRDRTPRDNGPTKVLYPQLPALVRKKPSLPHVIMDNIVVLVGGLLLRLVILGSACFAIGLAFEKLIRSVPNADFAPWLYWPTTAIFAAMGIAVIAYQFLKQLHSLMRKDATPRRPADTLPSFKADPALHDLEAEPSSKNALEDEPLTAVHEPMSAEQAIMQAIARARERVMELEARQRDREQQMTELESDQEKILLVALATPKTAGRGWWAGIWCKKRPVSVGQEITLDAERNARKLLAELRMKKARLQQEENKESEEYGHLKDWLQKIQKAGPDSEPSGPAGKMTQ